MLQTLVLDVAGTVRWEMFPLDVRPKNRNIFFNMEQFFIAITIGLVTQKIVPAQIELFCHVWWFDCQSHVWLLFLDNRNEFWPIQNVHSPIIITKHSRLLANWRWTKEKWSKPTLRLCFHPWLAISKATASNARLVFRNSTFIISLCCSCAHKHNQ